MRRSQAHNWIPVYHICPRVFFSFLEIAESQRPTRTSLKELEAGHTEGAGCQPHPVFVVFRWFWTYIETWFAKPSLAKLITTFYGLNINLSNEISASRNNTNLYSNFSSEDKHDAQWLLRFLEHCASRSSKMASAGGGYIESLIGKLSPKSESITKKALTELTKLTKVKENVHWFCVKGGLKRLLSLIQPPNRTIADMALSALANCALEQESRREVSVRGIKVGTSLFIFIGFMIFKFYFFNLVDKEIGWISCPRWVTDM